MTNRIKKSLKDASDEILNTGKIEPKEPFKNDGYFDFRKAKVNQKSKQGDKYRTTILLNEDSVKKVNYLNFIQGVDKTLVYEKSINLFYDLYYFMLKEKNINILDEEFELNEIKKHIT
jgi:hypothetical protein